MKAKYTLLIPVSLMLFLNACKKQPVQASILGKWIILSDSTYVGVGANNHPVNYTGVAGDYFDFRNDGFAYTKEGPVLDTLSYKLVSNTSMIIEDFGAILNGVPETSSINKLTTHELLIAAPRVITPGGVFGRTVHLSR